MGTCETKMAQMKEGDVETYSRFERSEQSSMSEEQYNIREGEGNPLKQSHNVPPGDNNAVQEQQEEVVEILEQAAPVIEEAKRAGKVSSAPSVQPKIKAGRPSKSPENRISDFKAKIDGSSSKKDPSPDRNTFEEHENKIKARESIHKKQRIEEEKKKKKSKINGTAGDDHKHINVFYSNENLLDVKKILLPEVQDDLEPDTVLFEGPLLKYRPGTTFFWMERWCVITRTEFRYYKAQWHALCADMKPLFSVPIAEVLAVFRVMLELPKFQMKRNFLQSDQKKYAELYQFEIFNSVTDYPYYNEILNREVDQEGEKEHQQLKPEFNVESLGNFKLWKNYEEDKRNKINSPSKVRKGYLMRPPMIGKAYTKTPGGALVSRESYSPYQTQNNESPQKTPEQYSPERGSKKSPSPAKKAVYKWVKQKVDMVSWTNREREWYYSEKRLLFATAKLEDREKWVAVLNWLVEESNASANRQQNVQTPDLQNQ